MSWIENRDGRREVEGNFSLIEHVETENVH